ncbi:hypothetical protein ACFL0B_00680 [Thermodesulfobacteriota bacterium]
MANREIKIDLVELPSRADIPNKIWLGHLFGGALRVFNGQLVPGCFPLFIVHGSVHVPRQERTIEHDILRQLSSEGRRFGLVHVMDENYDHNLSAYQLPGCELVFREYIRPRGGALRLAIDFAKSMYFPLHVDTHFRVSPQGLYRWLQCQRNGWRFMKHQLLPKIDTNKVRHIPLGYTDRMAVHRDGSAVPIVNRKYRWSFCGDSSRSGRKEMIEHMSHVGEGFVHEYHDFTSTDLFPMASLSGKEYWEILSQSVYIPCPCGNVNIDTYRLFEALEAGAIPIVPKAQAWQMFNYYRLLLGDNPIPTFSNWKEARAFVKRTDIGAAAALAEEIHQWYQGYKERITAEVNQTIRRVANVID